MTFQSAVEWFKTISDGVEPGPRLGEVTIYWHHSFGSKQTQVVDAECLPGMAKVSQSAHLRNRLPENNVNGLPN